MQKEADPGGVLGKGGSVDQRPRSQQPDEPAVRWDGVVLRVFDSRPFAKAILKKYAFLSLTGYCALIALANSLRWSWLQWWLDLWKPVVRVMRGVFPVFDNSAAALMEIGFGHRIEIIHHLLMICWLMCSIIFGYLTWSVIRLTSDEWQKFVRIAGRFDLTLRAICLAIFFGMALCWATIGFAFGSELSLGAFHRHDLSLIMIGIIFYVIAAFGTGIQILLGAEVTKQRFERQTSDRLGSSDKNRPP